MAAAAQNDAERVERWCEQRAGSAEPQPGCCCKSSGKSNARDRAGEMMVFGLIEQADRIGKATQRALAAQIEQLGKLQARVEASVGNLEAERARLGAARPALEQSAGHAMREAVRAQGRALEEQAAAALRGPLREIEQAAGYVRRNIRKASRLLIGLVFTADLLLGYWPLRASQNGLEDRLERIEQFLSSLSQPMPAPPAPARKGKAR